MSSAVAQSRQVTEADLTRLKAQAAQARKGLSLREKRWTTGYDKEDSSESLSEFGPGDTHHYLVIRRAKGVETRTEGIRIGEVRYTRQNDGNWIKEPPPTGWRGFGIGSGSGSGNGTGDGSTTPPEKTTEYLYLGKEKIDGKETDHYRKTSVVKFTSRTSAFTRRFVEDYWFDASGLLIKESLEDEVGSSNRRYKRVAIYDYTADIKITAPIPD